MDNAKNIILFLTLLAGCGSDIQGRQSSAQSDLNQPDLDESDFILQRADGALSDAPSDDLSTVEDVNDNEEEVEQQICNNRVYLGRATRHAQQFSDLIRIKDNGYIAMWRSNDGIEIRRLNNQGEVIDQEVIFLERDDEGSPAQLIKSGDFLFGVFFQKEGKTFFRTFYQHLDELFPSYTLVFVAGENFRAVHYERENGGQDFPFGMWADSKWWASGDSGLSETDLDVGSERIYALSWNGSSLISVSKKQDEWMTRVRKGDSDFDYSWSLLFGADAYAGGIHFDEDAAQSGRHAALVGQHIIIENPRGAPHELTLDLLRAPDPGISGSIDWNGSTYSVVVSGGFKGSSDSGAYALEVDASGRQVGEVKILVTNPPRSIIRNPVLVADSPTQSALIWTESIENEVFFGCFDASEF